MALRVDGDVFLEPLDGEFLAYAPLHNVAFIVDSAGAEFIASLRGKGIDVAPEGFRHLVDFLDRIGLTCEPPTPPGSAAEAYEPTQVLLILTENCNLRCRYCYSRGGDSSAKLPMHVAKAAIDLVVENGASRGVTAKVRYHGGGEPTLRWDELTCSARYFRDRAREAGVESHIILNTNGTLSEAKSDWIVGNVDSIFLSFDGPREFQDMQRPFAGGGGSFDKVWRTMERLTAAGKPFAIRATVTSENCDRLPDFVELVAPLGIRGLEFEPLTVCGRAHVTGASAPSPRQYVEAYKEACRRARSRGLRILYSGLRLDGLSPAFCGAAGRNFAVTPQGLATLCHRVSDPLEPGADRFIFGRFSEATARFEFDLTKVDRMSGLHCDASAACNGCFAKWNCGGGCYAQNLAETGHLLLPARNAKCVITRELTRFALKERLREAFPP